MKINPKSDIYLKVFNGIKRIASADGDFHQVCQTYIEKKSRVALAWYLFNAVAFDLENPDNHPAYRNGRTRYNDYDANFDMYDDNTLVDSHWQTALLHMLKELGI